MEHNERNKWNARKTERDGYSFDSKWEADRYSELCLLQMAGEITDLMVLKGKIGKFDLHRTYKCERTGKWEKPSTYQPDFFYFDSAGNKIYEDAKGQATASSKVKRKIVESLYGITVWFVYRDGGRD